MHVLGQRATSVASGQKIQRYEMIISFNSENRSKEFSPCLLCSLHPHASGKAMDITKVMLGNWDHLRGWRLKPSFVQFLKITANSPWVCSEGFQALHGAQEMGETYNMMMELLLTAGSSSSSGGSSPDVVVGEIAKDRCYGMLCLQDEPLTSHGTPCPSKETKYETMFSWVCS